MKNLDIIANDLFNKIRGRFPTITLGNEKGEVTNVPQEARFFDFDYMGDGKPLGKINVTLTDQAVTVMYSNDFVTNEDEITKNKWFNFLKELRVFAKKRMLSFDTRNITKSNLDKRDYKFLVNNSNKKFGESKMESKMYGTATTSYQKVGNARLAIKHIRPINQESATGRIQGLGSIYVESAEGERFKYPFKHLNGARAMARHVSEGGNPYDDFGKHITGLSEELANLKKFKTYMGRSAVMAESLGEYMDAVKERIETVKKTVSSLQKESYYKEAVEGFEVPVLEDVPSDVVENWIDQLTIRQFNEELSDVFPYIYKLVSEVTKAKELGPEDVLGEGPTWDKFASGVKQAASAVGDAVLGSEEEAKAEDALATHIVKVTGDETAAGRVMGVCRGNTLECLYSYIKEKGLESSPAVEAIAKQFGLKGNANMQVDHYDPEAEFESAIEKALGQFAEGGITLPQPDQEPQADDHTLDKQVAMNKAAGEKDLGNGFVSFTYDHAVAGNVPAIKDTNSGMVIIQNKRAGSNSAIIRSPARYIMIPPEGSNQKGGPAMKLGPQTQAAADKAFAESDDTIDVKIGPDGSLSKVGADKLSPKKEKKLPISEFILSMFDRHTGEFPKGETAVLTKIEKDYGEDLIQPAKAFIEKIRETYDQYQMENNPQQMEFESEYARMRELAGLK